MRSTFCPACGRAIMMDDSEWQRSIECVRCNTQFVPAVAQRARDPRTARPEPQEAEALPPDEILPPEPGRGPLVVWEDEPAVARSWLVPAAVFSCGVCLLGALVLITCLSSRRSQAEAELKRLRAAQAQVQPQPRPREEPQPAAREEQALPAPGPARPPDKAEGDAGSGHVKEKMPAAKHPVGASPPPDHQADKPPEPTPVPGTLAKELVPGYETRQLHGFIFLLSTQAIREAKQDGGKPFQALVTEFDGLIKVLPPNALKVLRRVLIWVEWDNVDRSSPRTLAKYYGGTIWRLDGSAHPLKSNAVELLSLKKLAQEKNLSVEQTRLVLLHELAHAVHHVLLGYDNVNVTFAYNQALDRRLYNKVLDDRGGSGRAYAATNAAEYFAELTCAYLDRCQYYPFTRDELREYDPTGYRLMEGVWGKVKP